MSTDGILGRLRSGSSLITPTVGIGTSGHRRHCQNCNRRYQEGLFQNGPIVISLISNWPLVFHGLWKVNLFFLAKGSSK